MSAATGTWTLRDEIDGQLGLTATLEQKRRAAQVAVESAIEHTDDYDTVVLVAIVATARAAGVAEYWINMLLDTAVL